VNIAIILPGVFALRHHARSLGIKSPPKHATSDDKSAK
jgi:hypothetical protein